MGTPVTPGYRPGPETLRDVGLQHDTPRPILNGGGRFVRGVRPVPIEPGGLRWSRPRNAWSKVGGSGSDGTSPAMSFSSKIWRQEERAARDYRPELSPSFIIINTRTRGAKLEEIRGSARGLHQRLVRAWPLANTGGQVSQRTTPSLAMGPGDRLVSADHLPSEMFRPDITSRLLLAGGRPDRRRGEPGATPCRSRIEPTGISWS